MSAVRTVDVHHHVTPKGLIEAARREGARYGASVERGDSGHEVLVLADHGRSSLSPDRWDETVRRQQLAAAGVDVGLESISPTAMFYRADRAQAEWFTRVVNDGIHENAAASDGHVIGMGYIPLQFPDLAVQELERATSEYGFPCVQIGTPVVDENFDEPRFSPFWEAAEALGTFIFVHPVGGTAKELMPRYYLTNFIGNPLGTTIAIASLIFGGVLDRYPKLKLCFAHAGGAAPYLRGRWRHGYGARPEPKERGASQPFDDYFHLLYFDSLSHDGRALEYLIGSVGTDRVLLGTDYPADMDDVKQVAAIRQLPGLTDEQKDAILGGNAWRLIGAS
ncbi:MAG: amidohydrolase [Chloroflexi bacterium]|nr:amidohydrolase [Chloroflexota bacterium]